jgi:hypothetical protein
MEHIFADYNSIADNLIVGSCPKTKDDISKLSTDEHVTAILNLQRDQDFGAHNVDIGSIKAECGTLGISYDQVPVCFLNKRHEYNQT